MLVCKFCSLYKLVESIDVRFVVLAMVVVEGLGGDDLVSKVALVIWEFR
jgi:hypothetical protein